MKKALLVLLTLTVPSLAAAQTSEQDVAALERAWLDAAVKYDVAWYDRYLADTIVATDSEGIVTGKVAILADLKSQASKETYSFETLKVQAYGDAAVATSITVVKGTFRGKDTTGRWAVTDVWVKRGGQWQCVATHISRIK